MNFAEFCIAFGFGVVVCFCGCMMNRQSAREDACNKAGGVMIQDNCLDIKRIPIIEK